MVLDESQDITATTHLPVVAGMGSHEFEMFLKQYLRHANLIKPSTANENAVDDVFLTSADFWGEITANRRMGLRWVKLAKFSIIDWYPHSPGLYHLPNAKTARELAQHFLTEKQGYLVYKPPGKMHMINGGIGSLRFKPVQILNEDCWLCTATSDEFCHTGIPLAIPNALFRQWDFDYSHTYELTGQVRYLPAVFEKYFQHYKEIPQVYVLVDKILQNGTLESPPQISPMVFFDSAKSETRTQYEVTYVNCSVVNDHELFRATDWLCRYVEEYSGEILSNFDQQRPMFRDAPFGLHRLMSGRVSVDSVKGLNIYNANVFCDAIGEIQSKEMIMSKIDVRLGDGVVVHGDMVVASSIKNSFNKALAAEMPEELGDLLKELITAVGQLSEALPEEKSQQVARDLDTFTTEITSKTPRKKWWELSVDGLKDAAKAVGDIGKPVLALLPQIVKLLGSS